MVARGIMVAVSTECILREYIPDTKADMEFRQRESVCFNQGIKGPGRPRGKRSA